MSEPEVVKKTSRQFWKLLLICISPFILIIGILLYQVINLGIITPIREKNMTVEQLINFRLDTWDQNKSDKSGVTVVRKNSEGEYEMWYNYFPLGVNEPAEEFAYDNSEKLIRLFMDRNDLNKLSVAVCLPYRDATLQTVWKPFMVFDLDRNTLSKYHYENFEALDLYTVCDNLKTYIP